MKWILPFAALASHFAPLAVAHGDDEHDFEWQVLDVKLSKAISDHSAVTSADGIVYIAGGCDSPDGNKFISTEPGEGFFACGSLSDEFYQFDFATREFSDLAQLPRERYRHSAALVNNQMWLIGGRTLEDQLIAEVDVFDITSGVWSTLPPLPENVVSSDHGSFTKDNLIYLAGGYDQNYTVARSEVYTIDADNSNAEDGYEIASVAPLLSGRGDITAILSDDGESAFVSGGFTPDNDFCFPIGSAEQYDFTSDAWTDLPELIEARGEVVLVELDDHLYSMGGEHQIDGICNITGRGADVGELTIGTDLIEAWDGRGSWKIVSGFPNHKFRFAAAVSSAESAIYVFGGQTAYETRCECFKVTDEIAVWGEKGGASLALQSASTLLAIISSVVALVAWI